MWILNSVNWVVPAKKASPALTTSAGVLAGQRGFLAFRAASSSRTFASICAFSCAIAGRRSASTTLLVQGHLDGRINLLHAALGVALVMILTHQHHHFGWQDVMVGVADFQCTGHSRAEALDIGAADFGVLTSIVGGADEEDLSGFHGGVGFDRLSGQGKWFTSLLPTRPTCS